MSGEANTCDADNTCVYQFLSQAALLKIQLPDNTPRKTAGEDPTPESAKDEDPGSWILPGLAVANAASVEVNFQVLELQDSQIINTISNTLLAGSSSVLKF